MSHQLETLILDPLTTDPGSPAEGEIWYNATTKNFSWVTDVSGVKFRVGQEILIRIYNNTAATLTKGSVVRGNGMSGGAVTVLLARADNINTATSIGLVVADVAVGAYGYVKVHGLLTGIDTSSWVVGNTLYLSTTVAGALQYDRPSNPDYRVPQAVVVAVDGVDGAVVVITGMPQRPPAQVNAGAPTDSDDSNNGYSAGDIWVNTNADPDRVYVCADASPNNAVWVPLLDNDQNSLYQVQKLVTATFASEYNNGNSGSTPTVNWNNGQKQRITLTAAATFTFTAPPGPGNLLLKIIQDATGGRAATWPATVKWPAGTAPTLTTDANAVDIVTFYYDGTNYYGVASLNFT
jgi:hypothetical protein